MHQKFVLLTAGMFIKAAFLSQPDGNSLLNGSGISGPVILCFPFLRFTCAFVNVRNIVGFYSIP